MKKYKKYFITYHLMPDSENITVEYLAKTEDEAAAFAKQYRKESFSIKEAEESTTAPA